MHITVIANNFQVEYINNLLNNLANKVEKLDLIGSSQYEKEKLDSRINLYYLRENTQSNASPLQKLAGILKYYKNLIKYLTDTKAQVIHVQWLRFPFVEGILLTILIRTLNKKVVYTAHNPLPHHKEGIYYRTLFKYIYSVQNEIVVHTQYIKNKLVEMFRIPPDKIHTVKHGVYDVQNNPSITGDLAREKLGLSKSSKVILFFGKIVAYKGFDTLVKSIDIVENEHFEILVAGRVSPSYQKEFDKILLNKKKGNYRLLIRYLSEKDVEYCFKAADVTALPYREASQSGVLFMSYSYGVPVIAPNLGGFPEDILPSKTGYIFNANDSVSLAKSIQQFSEEWAESRIEDREFIIKFAEKNYSWDASCTQLVEIYKQLQQ